MFTVDYEPGGAAQVHDHPFEEAYFFLDGEVEGELDGEQVTLRRGRCRLRRRRLDPRLLQHRHAAACAGSRPRRRSRRRGTPIAGSMPGSGSRSDEMTSDGCIVVVGGTAGIGKELARYYAGTGRETILTGRVAATARGRRRRDRRHGARDRLRPRQTRRRSATRWRRSGPCATSRSSPSSATTTRSATSTSTGRWCSSRSSSSGSRRSSTSSSIGSRPTARSSCSAARPRTGRIRARRPCRP